MNSNITFLLMALVTVFPIYNICSCSGEQFYISSTLNINVVTDKQVYNAGESVQIYGNLTLDGNPVTNGLAALQIDDAKNIPFVLRTLPTGVNITGSWNIEILDVFIGDLYGNPISSVEIGSTAYVWIFYRNNCPVAVRATIAFTIYDAETVPIFVMAPISLEVQPNGPYFVTSDWIVPTNAKPGNAIVYASAYTRFPSDAGVPYCPEKSATFTIETSTTSTSIYPANPQAYSSSLEGNYNSTLKLPTIGATIGNYTIFVASYYQGRQATSKTTFKVRLFCDVNEDGKVDGKDVALTIKAFGSYPGHPKWNPNADMNGDNKVDGKDIALIIKNYGKHI
jgi:hypothetical protein